MVVRHIRMVFFDFLKKKGAVNGVVVIHGLPTHEMYSVSLTAFKVASAESPPPFNGDPPIEEWENSDYSVKEAEEPDDKPLHFSFETSPGFYYFGVGVIAFISKNDKMFAQVERFFPMTQPIHIQVAASKPLELVASWPDIPFEELSSYGTMHPQ